MKMGDGDEAIAKRDHSAADTARTLQASIDSAEDKLASAVPKDEPMDPPEIVAELILPADSPEKTATEGEREATLDAPSNKDAVEYPTGTRLLLINLSLCLSIFVTALVSLH